MIKRNALFPAVSMLLLGFCLTACSNNDSEKESSEANETSFVVGSTLKISGLDYTVISNTVSGSTSRAATDNIIDASLVANERAKKYAQDIFGDNVLLIRVAGKVTVPQGQKEKYKKAYDSVVPETIPAGFRETDLFTFNSKSDDEHLFYSDIFLVLASEDVEKSVGTIKVQWNSSYIKSFSDAEGNKKTFSEVLEDFSPEVIRNTVPTEFKTSKADGYLLSTITTDSDGNLWKEQHPVEGCGYYSKNKTKNPRPAATFHTYWNKDGSWSQIDIGLCPIYGSENAYSGAFLTVNNEGDSYSYYVRGQSGKTSNRSFSFTDGKYVGESLNIADLTELSYSTDVTKYDDTGLPYTEKNRTIPIEFVQNADGTVDFGESVYAWCREWKNTIIEKNSDKAADYAE